MRFGLGPVFAYERLVTARRWQTYAARSVMVAALLVAMMTIASSHTSPFMASSAQRFAKLGESYFYALIGVELALVMLAAPAATAGAICLDRARGNLAHVMATDLSDSEIVLGKLAARLLPVMGLVACTWPVMAISTLLGGIDPLALTLAFAIIVTVALLGCTIALALSVWARKPHEVILATYVFWLGALMAWPIGFAVARTGLLGVSERWTLLINPFYLANAPYVAPWRFDFWDYALFFSAAIGASGVLVLLAVWRMRPVTTRQASAAGKSPGLGLIGRIGRSLPGPSLDGNPVLWREWHRSRPSLWMTILVALLGGTTGLACCIGAFAIWRHGVVGFGMPGPAHLAGIFGYLIQLILGMLMLSVLAPLSMSEERQRDSLDVLVVTPLSTWSIVLGKWWGTFRLVPVLAIGPGLMAFALATARRAAPLPGVAVRRPDVSSAYSICGAALMVATILVHGAAMTSIGLALATWIKRQVRAIVTSVCVFVLVAVGWPILVSNSFRPVQGMSSLSPLFVALVMADELAMRFERLAGILWWVGFWDVGVAAFAIGLLWLTWRTFDLGLGRIPETPRTSPVLADVITAFGGTTAASCLYIAVTVFVRGVNPHSLTSQDRLEQDVVLYFIVLVLLGMLLLSAVAPLSISAELRRERRAPSDAAPRSGRSIVLTQWWRLFRVLSFLAVGPSLIAIALAVAPTIEPPVSTAVRRTLPNGGQVARVIESDQAAAINTLARWEVPLGDRLRTAAMLVMTILAFGALMIGAGLALGTWIPRRNWAVGVSIGLFLLSALIWPTLGMAQLFTQLVTREPQLGALGGLDALTSSLIANILLVIILLGLTIRTIDRRSRTQHEVPISVKPLPSI
jgi:ABC-type transport system involved in multi-copper enzyme maturation permease subunit